jgi:hypothetical protein
MSAGEREQEAERHSATKHVYEVRPRKDHRGLDLISDVLPFGRLWYDGPNAVTNEIGYAEQHSRSHNAVIRLRCRWQRDRVARAGGLAQRVLNHTFLVLC